MSYQQLDKIADLFIPLFIAGLLIAAGWFRQKGAFLFVLRSALAVVVVQQLAKYMQKAKLVGGEWPSTHFAVFLALSVCLVVL
jgi:hypothetical protein